MELLYLNNIQVDLPQRSISLTSQINDIAELKDRQADYSNTVKLPMTSKNIQIMDMLGIAGNKSRKPYTQVEVKYIYDGIEIITKGKGVIRNTNSYYNLVIYSGNIDVVDLLGNSQLNELDFSTYNHNLSVGSWLNSFTNTEGYIYGLGKFYDGASTSTITLDLQNVSFYVHTLFEMIFTQQGYTITGNILNDADFKSRVISMDIGYDRTSINNDTQVYQYDSTGNSVDETYSFPVIELFEITSYVVENTGVHTVNTSGDFTKTYGENFAIQIVKNGFTFVSNEIPETSFSFDAEIQVQVGDVITINVFAESVTDRIAFNPSFVSTIVFNDVYIPITIPNIIGSIKQYDFVKEIMQHFGMVMRRTRNKNQYEFTTMAELLSDISNAEDWSGKYSNFINESYKSGYSQLNTIKYKYDSNEDNSEQTFADGSFEISDVNLSDSKTLFTSIFKACENDNSLPILNHWIDKKEDKVDIISPNTDGLRTFKIDLLTDNVYYKFNDTIESRGNYNGSIAYLNFDAVNYQAEIDKWYTQITSMLNDYKAITLEVDLSLVDYYNRDFFKLKEFKQLGRYYYLNKISAFKKGEKTKIEIIEVSEIIQKIKQLTGSSTGSSAVSAILSKVAFGTLEGYSYGSSMVTGFLQKYSYTEILISSGTDEGSACGSTPTTSKYYTTSGLPTIGDIIYDSAGGSPFNGGSLWYKSALDIIWEINSVGVITDETLCI